MLANLRHKSLRALLVAKARLGHFDNRMCSYYGVSPRVNRSCQKFICRAYVAGLVPTSTRGGDHAYDSYHYKGRAVDVGLRKDLIGTRKGQARLRIFQRKEMWRRSQGRIHPVELLGPDNDLAILAGRRTRLVSGSALENQHDNHVHEAY